MEVPINVDSTLSGKFLAFPDDRRVEEVVNLPETLDCLMLLSGLYLDRPVFYIDEQACQYDQGDED